MPIAASYPLGRLHMRISRLTRRQQGGRSHAEQRSSRSIHSREGHCPGENVLRGEGWPEAETGIRRRCDLRMWEGNVGVHVSLRRCRHITGQYSVLGGGGCCGRSRRPEKSGGVTFEEYDMPGIKTVDGIATGGGANRRGSRTRKETSLPSVNGCRCPRGPRHEHQPRSAHRALTAESESTDASLDTQADAPAAKDCSLTA